MDIWDKIDHLIGHTLQPNSEKIFKKNKINIEIDIYISRLGTYINTDELDIFIVKKIKNYFTVRDKTIMGYIKNTTNYTHYDEKLYIPRFGSFILKNKFNKVNHHNLIAAKNPINTINFIGEFQGNQKLIFDEILNNWYNKEKTDIGKSGLILNLQAGMGKSFLAMALIGYLKCRTLIVTHNKAILQQWEKILCKFLPDAKIGVYYGQKKTYGDIVVGVINSLVMDTIKDFDSWHSFYNTFDFVILDEAHEYCSANRSKIYSRCQAPYMLGLSATPNERTDNLDKINHWGIGQILEASKISQYSEVDIPFKGNVIHVKYSGPDRYTRLITNKKLEIMSAPLMIAQLTQDEFRLKLIVDLILEHHEKNHNIFVFADRRDYLSEIEIAAQKKQKNVTCHYLTNEREFRKLESIRLVGGSSVAEMKLAESEKTIILSTYQYMATGTSIPKMNCLVLATPRKSKIRQIVGRIFRLGSDYSVTRQIIDIVDIKTGLKNQYYSRKKYYDEQGYSIETRTVSYFDINI